MVKEAREVHPEMVHGNQSGGCDLPLLELVFNCQQEIEAFYQGTGSNDCYAMDLFRRAVLEKDEQMSNWAWCFIFYLFSPLVIAWIRQDTRSLALLKEIGKDSLVNSVFAKFALLLKRTPEKILEFPSLGAILRYMKLTSRSVIANELRSLHTCFSVVDLSDAVGVIGDEDPLEYLRDQEEAGLIWRIVAEESFPKELFFLQLTFIEGLKPSEILAHYPDVFCDVEELYTIRRTVFERLRKNQRLAQWAASRCIG